MASLRDRRLLTPDKTPDQRSAAQRDSDRILYSSAFRRLGGVTQVALAREDGHLLHNRLTHSLKVAQVGRRVAEMLQERYKPRDLRLIRARGGLDPDTVEAACLAHDLGHPPFGHIAEYELRDLVRAAGIEEGFEGNAQTFRIVTRLSINSVKMRGLNLSRATLNAVLKYPWLWTSGRKKWGCFAEDQETFHWVRRYPRLEADVQTLEAQIMDWADDIAYAVHDVEDWYRAGLIPLHEYRSMQTSDLGRLFGVVRQAWDSVPGHKPLSQTDLDAAAETTILGNPLTRIFDGQRGQRAELRNWTGVFIGRFVQASRIGETGLEKSRSTEIEVAVLKGLTQLHVVENPALQTQQFGQRRVIRDLFETYLETLRERDTSAFPGRVKEEVESLIGRGVPGDEATRFVTDLIAGMTEEQALRSHRRLTGIDLGPLMDPAAN